MANRTTWAKRIERWRDSGLTAKEFAAETGLNPRTMAYWKWKLKKEGDTQPPRARRKPAPATFVELALGEERGAVVGTGSGVVLPRPPAGRRVVRITCVT